MRQNSWFKLFHLWSNYFTFQTVLQVKLTSLDSKKCSLVKKNMFTSENISFFLSSAIFVIQPTFLQLQLTILFAMKKIYPHFLILSNLQLSMLRKNLQFLLFRKTKFQFYDAVSVLGKYEYDFALMIHRRRMIWLNKRWNYNSRIKKLKVVWLSIIVSLQ